MKMFPLTSVLLFILRLRFPPGSSVRRILISRYGQTALNRLLGLAGNSNFYFSYVPYSVMNISKIYCLSTISLFYTFGSKRRGDNSEDFG